MRLLLLGLLLAASPAAVPPPGGAAPRPGAMEGAPRGAHDLHLTSANAAVEGNLLAVRIRFFKSDLEAALRATGTRPDFVMKDDPSVDAVFMAYFRERFIVWVGDDRMQGTILAKGEDKLDREPVWWYAVQFRSPGDVLDFRVRNTLLLELFDDQRNVVKFVHFPDETQKTYSFGHGEEEFEVSFEG